MASKSADQQSFRPTYIFVYGSLMDGSRLRSVLGLRDMPSAQPAAISGWVVRMWGRYPALVPSANNSVPGMAYRLEKAKHLERLEKYEGDSYRLEDVEIKIAGGRSVRGRTFVWNGEKKELTGGKFDLKDWVMGEVERSGKIDIQGHVKEN